MWFSVRYVLDAGEDTEGTRSYEERITIWNTDSFEQAHALARAEAERHATLIRNGRALDLFQVFMLFDEPVYWAEARPEPTTDDIFSAQGHGTEVFSLIRETTLSRLLNA